LNVIPGGRQFKHWPSRVSVDIKYAWPPADDVADTSRKSTTHQTDDQRNADSGDVGDASGWRMAFMLLLSTSVAVE
jgi:hypothetical protein